MTGGPPAQAWIARNSGAGWPINCFHRSSGGSGRATTSGSECAGRELFGCGLEPEDPHGAVAQRRREVPAVGRDGDIADRELARLADPDRLPKRAVTRVPDLGEAVAADAQQRAAVGAEGQVIGPLVEAVERPLFGQAPEDDDRLSLLFVRIVPARQREDPTVRAQGGHAAV